MTIAMNYKLNIRPCRVIHHVVLNITEKINVLVIVERFTIRISAGIIICRGFVKVNVVRRILTGKVRELCDIDSQGEILSACYCCISKEIINFIIFFYDNLIFDFRLRINISRSRRLHNKRTRCSQRVVMILSGLMIKRHSREITISISGFDSLSSDLIEVAGSGFVIYGHRRLIRSPDRVEGNDTILTNIERIDLFLTQLDRAIICIGCQFNRIIRLGCIFIRRPASEMIACIVSRDRQISGRIVSDSNIRERCNFCCGIIGCIYIETNSIFVSLPVDVEVNFLTNTALSANVFNSAAVIIIQAIDRIRSETNFARVPFISILSIGILAPNAR